jgi:hypothetical protein
VVTDSEFTETSGNDDGFLDAGESGEMVVEIVNYGADASNVTATLSSDDLFLDIQQNFASFDDLPSGAGDSNSESPFILSASSEAPLGHQALLYLTVDSDQGQCITSFHFFVGRFHYLVWDPTSDESSGPVIASTLEDLGYRGIYSRGLPLAEELPRFSTLWISLGVRPNASFVGSNSNVAGAINSYLMQGGACYLEGGDVWNYDLLIGGFNFGPRFALSAPHDGDDQCGPILGLDGCFTEGMEFAYAGEAESIDRLWHMSFSTRLLKNDYPAYTLAVAYDAPLYKTVGASFEFAGLVDGLGNSTKSQLAQNIMSFFLEQSTNVPPFQIAAQLAAWPNPFNPKTSLSFHIAETSAARLSIHDVQGRHLRLLHEGALEAGEHRFEWDGLDEAGRVLPSGLYFARLKEDRGESSLKLMLLK